MRLGPFVLALTLTLTFGCDGGSGGDTGGDDDFVDRMAAEHQDDEPVASAAAAAGPANPVETERLVYATLDGGEVTGYLARPEGPARGLPAILVIHEWWGLNPNIESMARQLAGQGYVALAVDLYGGEVAEDRDRARELMTAVSENRVAAKKNLRQAHSYLERRYKTDKTGVIGWCFGGGWSLRTAIMLPDKLDAAIIYYGRLIADREMLAELETPILGFFGSEDQGIPVAGVREFEQTLAELGKSASIHVYEGAGHAFANPSGNRYHAEAATDAWQKTLAFLRQHLGILRPMPTFVVGDVHGCFDALRGLLADCGFDRDRDRLWLVGDLVNRGPKSLEVLRWATDLAARLGERMVVVAGNHDLHLVGRHLGISAAKRKDTLDAVLAAPDAGELVGWLRRRPLVHREEDCLLVHAGLLPSWTPEAAEHGARRVERSLRDDDTCRELLTRPLPPQRANETLPAVLAAFTRLRTCTVDGRPCEFAGPPDQAPPGCIPWFRIPGRRSREATVICGHWAALGLHREAGVIALDSGAAWGGRLTALRLEDGEIFQRPVIETRSA